MSSAQRYSDFLRQVAASLEELDPYICNAIERLYTPENEHHCVRLKLRVNSLLKKELQSRVQAHPRLPPVEATVLVFYFIQRAGDAYSPLEERRRLLNRMAVYYESKGE